MMNFDSFNPCVFLCFLMKCLWIMIVCCMLIRMLCLICNSGAFGQNLENVDEDLHDLHRVLHFPVFLENFLRNLPRNAYSFLRIACGFPADFWIHAGARARVRCPNVVVLALACCVVQMCTWLESCWAHFPIGLAFSPFLHRFMPWLHISILIFHELPKFTTNWKMIQKLWDFLHCDPDFVYYFLIINSKIVHGWIFFGARRLEHVCLLDLALPYHLWNAGFWSNAYEILHAITRLIAWHFGVDLVFLSITIAVLWSC